ncbi:MAG: ABC transporter permease [Clostridia bacterium]|nr:ABC transporter permease [Clostridia bacterium]
MSNKKAGSKGLISDFKRFTPLLQNLVSKDFKVKYRRSVLGIAWSVLNPLLTMLVLTAVFSKMLRIQVDGDFATYYIVGASLWNFFAEATSNSMTSILGSAALIKKVYIPKYIFPLEKCLFSLVSFSLSLVAVFLVMIFRSNFLPAFPSFTILLAPVAIFYCFLFVCGMSLLLSALTVFFRDIIHLYSVLLTMWMYMTPVFYQISMVDGADPVFVFIRNIIRCNPMYHYINYFRNVMIYGVVPSLKDNLICFGVGLAVLALGWVFFRKTEKKFILHI